jgi:peptide/nickel transport system substrate-binding protein
MGGRQLDPERQRLDVTGSWPGALDGGSPRTGEGKMSGASSLKHVHPVFASRLTRRQVLRGMVIVGAAPSLSSLLAACTGKEEVAPTPVEEITRGGTLRIATPYTVSTLDPIKSVAAGDIEVLGQIYSRLVRRGPDGKEILPGLAESWEPSSDGLTWTFSLREANFSDGSPITADDVVFSFLRLRDQKDSAYGGAFQVIADIVALDTKTVEFTLTGPAAPFLGSTEQFNAGIVPKSVVEDLGDEEFGRNPVTSGGFRVTEWRPNERLILEANPEHWREGLPYLGGVEVIEVLRDPTRVSMLEAGEADVAREVPWPQIEEFKQRDDMIVPLDPSSTIYVVLLNHKDPLLKDATVREALAMAIDRVGITKAVTFGNATPANSLIPNTVDYYDPEATPPPYDPDQARQLIEQAGATSAKIEFLTTSIDDQATQLVQDQLKAVGIDAVITQVDVGGWWDRVVNADYGAAVTWWYNEVPDPDPAVRWALCGTCGNSSYYTFYDNKEVDQLTEDALHATDPTEREALYRDIQRIAMEDVAQIPLWYQPYQNVYRSWVHDLKMNPAIQWNLDEAWMNP